MIHAIINHAATTFRQRPLPKRHLHADGHKPRANTGCGDASWPLRGDARRYRRRTLTRRTLTGRRRSDQMGRRADSKPYGNPLLPRPAARCPGDRLAAPGLAGITSHPTRRDPFVFPGCREPWSAHSGAGGRIGLRPKPGGACCPLSPGRARRRQPQRLSLGC